MASANVTVEITLDTTKMTAVFDEWARRYEADPASFGDILDEDGKLVEGYGARCAHYYHEIHRELFGAA